MASCSGNFSSGRSKRDGCTGAPGRPDVELRRATKSEQQIPHPRSRPDAGRDRVRDDNREDADLYVAEVRGFDYYNTRDGTIESGDTSKIAMWLLRWT